MPSYAMQATRMEGRLGNIRNPDQVDAYKQDRAQIEEMRTRLARELRLERLRFEMDVNRWLR